MILAITSDTHGRPFTIPPCDVFIHAGDITAGGSLAETSFFADALRQAKGFKCCFIVPGNHDKCFQEMPSEVWGLFDGRVSILQDSGIEYEGKTFWGSPWTPPFFDWNFMKTEEELAEVYKSMPDKVDVLITHGPPRGILDPGWKEPHVGSTSLLYAIAARNNLSVGAYNIKHHVFGHLHGAGGKSALNHPFGPTFHIVNHPLILEIL